MSNSELRVMISIFSEKASPRLGEDDNPTYTNAVQRASKQFICDRWNATTCADADRWPKEKHESWPAKLVVWVKGCPGFVGDLFVGHTGTCGVCTGTGIPVYPVTQTLEGPFSAISNKIFATKDSYSICSKL